MTKVIALLYTGLLMTGVACQSKTKAEEPPLEATTTMPTDTTTMTVDIDMVMPLDSVASMPADSVK